MRFEFATTSRIIFGNGTSNEAASIAAQMGNRAFVVTGHTTQRVVPLLEQFDKKGIKCTTFCVSNEPTVSIAKNGIEQARQTKSELVVSIGGGSVLDTGKIIAAMLTNSGQLEDYLELVGCGKAVTSPCVPHIAIPTTAGTGAEVTRNAVIAVPEHGAKVSMRSPLILPTVAIVDPVLTYSMPQAITAGTGLDAITQLIEAYTSIKANPFTDCFCREGLKRASRSLYKAYEDGSNRSAREDMALASLFSGLSLANAGLGAVHGIAGPLGGMISAPHGVICARLLPFVMQANIRALQMRAADSPALARYDEIARLLTGRVEAKASNGVAWAQKLCEMLKIPSLAQIGLKEQDFPTVVTKSKNSSSMKGNPITLTDDELLQILQKSD
jgi:alcohol dehydrogenase class IV